jgi:SAM-dependent methyltransferase
MLTGSVSNAVARYWDANKEKSKDPTYWMAHPLCRQAINRRVSGNPNEWPLEWFSRAHGSVPFGRGVSWGCGLGAFERDAIRKKLVCEIDAFDISSASLEDARRAAEAEAISGIHYAIGSFDDPHLEAGRYDIVFFHASLHHVSKLERLFERLKRALKPGGAVYVDEYVGPSRRDWSFALLQKAQRVLDGLPEEGKIGSKIDLPIERSDPSEAIRSSEIRPFLRDYFDILEWRPFGGQIAGLVFPYLRADWTQSSEGTQAIERILALEDEELSRDPGTSHHLVAYGRLKNAASLPTWSRRIGQRARQALRRS